MEQDPPDPTSPDGFSPNRASAKGTSGNGTSPDRTAPGWSPFDWTDEEARHRERSGLVRTIRPRPADSGLLDLAGNDYLGLTRHPAVTGAAADAARRWGAGATGSRLVTGSTELHAEL
ncbi:8-amino-7-oxononanoate synthase, partial [Streptomyces sp. NPDC087850]